MIWLSLRVLQCVSNRDLRVIFFRTQGHNALIEVHRLERMDFTFLILQPHYGVLLQWHSDSYRKKDTSIN